MFRHVIVAVTGLGALAIAATWSTGAQAQQAGVYSGTAADGSPVSFTIGTDPQTGALQVQSTFISVTDLCNPNGSTFSTAWGLGGDGTDLTGATGKYTYSFSYFYVTATLKFVGSTLTGNILNATPILVPPMAGAGEPRKAAYCYGKKQTYTATLGAAAAHPNGSLQGANYGGTITRH